jgi:plastocyanin
MLAASVAEAGVIRGTLYLSQTLPRGDESESREALKQAQRGVADGVVYIEQIPSRSERKLSGHGWFFFTRHDPIPRVVQKNLAFAPRVTSVTAGGSVSFENLDRVYHDAFSVSSAKRFDLGKNSLGRIDTVTFERAGVVNLHCAIHPQMTAYIVVLPNHAYARPNADGAFALPGLPPGRYVLHAWHPRWGDTRREVELPARADCTVQVAFGS